MQNYVARTDSVDFVGRSDTRVRRRPVYIRGDRHRGETVKSLDVYCARFTSAIKPRGFRPVYKPECSALFSIAAAAAVKSPR